MKRTLTLLTSALVWIAGIAMPADRTPVTIDQPDGTRLTLRLIGDEYYHFHTTADGYTLLYESGAYRYARLNADGRLEPTDIVAHNADRRTPAEHALLATVTPYLTDHQAYLNGENRRAVRDRKNAAAKAPVVDYSNFRGLIVLIEYNDKQFVTSDPQQLYTDMANQADYTGFTFRGLQRCTGSMRDYFYDNSGGIFEPQFDVVYTKVDYSCLHPQGTAYANEVFEAALHNIDNQVDFTRYDLNGDGQIDMVYFLVAGYSANYSGNNQSYLWPHMSYLYHYNSQGQWEGFITLDGVEMGRYASSTELYGWESQGTVMPLGIGTMAHEFSHVLGLPDLYDTDYSTGGQSHDPGGWDVMAKGDYNYGRTPVAYTAFERYALGWNNLVTITTPGTYTLNNVGTTGDGLILRSPVDNEFFVLDNRQKQRWDAYLPGHGMIIARVDSTNARVWAANRVNANPSHNYYELLRAGGSTEGTQSSDPFPGTDNVTFVANHTNPSLKTWNGTYNTMAISDITEKNGIITFTVTEAEQVTTSVEDFETMAPFSTVTANNVAGRFAPWNFIKMQVTEPDPDQCNGLHAVTCINPSQMEMASDVKADIFAVEFVVYNNVGTTAKFQLSYSTNGGSTWTSPTDGAFSVSGNRTDTITWKHNFHSNVRFRINMTSGTKSAGKCFIDDFTIYHTGTLEGFKLGDINHDGYIDTSDINIMLNTLLGISDTYKDQCDLNGDGITDLADLNMLINLMLQAG